jgi:polyisoprenoid-binding protein YceI
MKKVLSMALLAAIIVSCNKNKSEAISFVVNGATSTAEWKGAAPDHFHTGAFNVTGSVHCNRAGIIKEGSFVIPIASITNVDLPDPVKQELLNHLKSPGFFNMALHPNAEFKITKVMPYIKADTAAIAGANYLITGDFSMIGETHSISFPAKISTTTDSLKTDAVFKIDRTNWGMKSYTDPANGLYISPNVDIRLTIQADRIQF